jgi:hypothetical protein
MPTKNSYQTANGPFNNPGGTTIVGTAYGVEINGAGNGTNAGAIYATAGIGVLIGGAGTVTNTVHAVISGTSYGIFFDGAGYIYNNGTLRGGQEGAYLSGVGHITNSTNAIISGGNFGIDDAAATNVDNAGTIAATLGIGVNLVGAGLVNNFAGGTISGVTDGLLLVAAGSVFNTGVITATATAGTGLSIGAAGLAVNEAGGTISGSLYGVDMKGVATLENAGTITGSSGTLGAAVDLEANGGILFVDPGAVFNGNVIDAGGAGQIGLNSGGGTVTGTLDMGSSFSGFSKIQFGVGASWLLAGNTAALAGTELISGFGVKDTIDLEGFTFTTDTYVSGTGLELANAANQTETLHITGSYTTSDFVVTNLADGSTQIVVCYLRGTKLRTAEGEMAVENIAIGDLLVTRFNGIQPVKWIGRQSFDARFIKNNWDQIPVRFAAGALGGGLPERDLYVSPGHSMLIGDALILARNLVNGITITQDELPPVLEYFQIEFAQHDCVQAEGTWSESFADGPDLRAKFHNVAEFWALYPDHETPAQLALCAPRPETGPALEVALRPIVASAASTVTAGRLNGCIDQLNINGIDGWAMDEANPDLPVLLEIRLSGRPYATILACDYREDLRKAGIGNGNHAFFFRAEIAAADLPHLTIHALSGAQILPALAAAA